MSLDAIKQALELLESAHVATDLVWKRYDCITALRAAIEQAHGDWDEVEALRASLREHMAEIQRLRDAIEQAQGKHEDWCASLTQLLLSMPPKPAPCNCKSKTASPRQWQGLTQREIDELWDLHHDDYGNALSATGYERAIEAKLRERNA